MVWEEKLSKMSKNNMFSVMSNQGFGDLHIIRDNCKEIIVSQSNIKKDGTIKKRFLDKMKKSEDNIILKKI